MKVISKKVKAYLYIGVLVFFVILGSCGEKVTNEEDNRESGIIEVKKLKDGIPAEEKNPNAIESLGNEKEQALAEEVQKDPIYTLEQFDETGSGTSENARQNNLVQVTEVPSLARSKSNQFRQINSNSNKPSRKRLSRLQARDLYYRGKYLNLTRFDFTSNELPQLYYKASAYFQLAHQTPKYSRKQIEHVRLSKNLYSRISETTRDPDLKGRSLLWLGILRWRFPAWNEDLEQQLSPLLYIQRRLKETRVYNDSLLYAGFIYEAHKRYDKAYRYYQKLGKTKANDWVYDDKVRKFNQPERVSRWYLQQLEQYQVKGLANQSRLRKPKRRTPPRAKVIPPKPPATTSVSESTDFESLDVETEDLDNFPESDINNVDFEAYRESAPEETPNTPPEEEKPKPSSSDDSSFIFD